MIPPGGTGSDTTTTTLQSFRPLLVFLLRSVFRARRVCHSRDSQSSTSVSSPSRKPARYFEPKVPHLPAEDGLAMAGHV